MMCDKKFENDSIVTPLPCEMRHYFHADCTELWMKDSSSCPVCHCEIEPKVIIETSRKYKRKVVEHLRCCYDTEALVKDTESSLREESELHDQVDDLAGEDYINL